MLRWCPCHSSICSFGVILWAINNYLPIDGKVKRIINVVTIIAIVLFLLNLFGIFGPLSQIRVGR